MDAMLYFIELDEEDNKFVEYENYVQFMSPEKQMQIRKFKFDIDKKLSLFADLYVRYLACTTFNLCNTDLVFDKNDYGKPYLVGFPNFQYNISHTRNAIAIGLSSEPMGVDIEKIRYADLKIAERFFCKNEYAYISTRPEQQDKLFYEIWTKKEAYIKWIGKGLSLPLTSFDVTDTALVRMLSTIELSGYIMSVCHMISLDLDLRRLTERQASEIFFEFAR